VLSSYCFANILIPKERERGKEREKDTMDKELVVSAVVGAGLTGLGVAFPPTGPVVFSALTASGFAITAAGSPDKADRIMFGLFAGGFAGYTLILLKRAVENGDFR